MGANEWNADAAAIFGEHFAHSGYDDIPSDAVEAVKKSVLDTLGVSLAATTLGAGGRELAELASFCRKTPEICVIVASITRFHVWCLLDFA